MSAGVRNELPKMIVLDFETNGAKGADGKLDLNAQLPVEVCAVRMVEGEPTSVFNTLIYYDGEWTTALENGHHTQDDLRKGMRDGAAASLLWDMILGAEYDGHEDEEENVVLVAYNATFDYTVLLNMFHRAYGHTGNLSITRILCPLTIARDRLQGGSHKLEAVCAAYGVELGEAHTAHDDTMALCELVVKMHEQEDITPYINVIGYKRQYGPPLPGTYPEDVTLKPQGGETVYHHADGRTERRTNVGRSHQQMVMGKPVAGTGQAPAARPTPPARPAPPAPGK